MPAVRVFSAAMANKLRQKHENGITIKALAEEYYCSHRTMYSVLHKEGAYKDQ